MGGFVVAIGSGITSKPSPDSVGAIDGAVVCGDELGKEVAGLREGSCVVVGTQRKKKRRSKVLFFSC